MSLFPAALNPIGCLPAGPASVTVLALSVAASSGAEKLNTTAAVRSTAVAPFAGVTSQRLKGTGVTSPPLPPHAAMQMTVITAKTCS